MQNKLLTLAISSALLSTTANAVELFKDEVNSLSLGGHLTAGIVGTNEGDPEVNTLSPRINLHAKRDIGNGFVVDAKGEWNVNLLDGGENSFSTRLGYLGLTHEEYGRTVIGTQWSPYYDVAGVTDLPIAFANDFLYVDQGNIGTARADKMLSYRNGFDLGAGTINFGLGWQGAHDDATVGYGNRLQASISYVLSSVTLGYAYNTGKQSGEDATTQAFSVNFGEYGNGFYGAAVYAKNKNVISDKTDNIEILAAYGLQNGLNIIANYESTEDKTTTFTNQTALQLEYNIHESIVGYTGYQLDLDDSDNSQWMLGARFFL